MDISKVLEVPMSDVELKGINVRTDLDTPNSQESLKELAESIRINGLMQPIILRGEYGKPPYDVIVGQRRYMAHRMLGEKTIKATFSGVIDDMDALLFSLSENMCRQELNYADTADAVTKLYNHYGKDEYEVQKHLGLSIRSIRNYIKIDEKATEKIKSLLRENKVSMADAKRAIDAAQGNTELADQLVDEIAKLTKYEKKRLVEVGQQKKVSSAQEMLEEARKPKLEESIILNLPLNVHKALILASEKMAVEPEEITMNALTTWLKSNNFLVEESQK